MRQALLGMVVLSLVCRLGAVSAGAAPITLKMYNGAGDTYTTVADTMISNYGGATGSEVFYNHGGEAAPSIVYSTSRVLLFNFDLSAIPDFAQVNGVNSATLRIYRSANIYGNGNWMAGQLAENWVGGTSSGAWDGVCDGAQWYTRNAGTVTPKASLVSAGGGIYYIDGVSNLADDPANTSRKFIRSGDAPGNFNNASSTGPVYAPYSTLADLQAAGSTRGYYWDSASNRLYVNKNDASVRWYKTADLWTTPGGGIVGSYIKDKSASGPAVPGWIDFDVKNIAQNWLVNGQANNGFRLYGTGQNTVYMSEYATDPTLRPELVLDLSYVPEPATLLLAAFGGAAACIRRRR